MQIDEIVLLNVSIYLMAFSSGHTCSLLPNRSVLWTESVELPDDMIQNVETTRCGSVDVFK